PPCDERLPRVIKSVVPQSYKAIPARLARLDEAHVLRLVFGKEQHATSVGRRTRRASDLCYHVLGGSIVDSLCGVETQAVQVVLGNPIARVGNEVLTYGPGLRAVE